MRLQLDYHHLHVYIYYYYYICIAPKGPGIMSPAGRKLAEINNEYREGRLTEEQKESLKEKLVTSSLQ